MSSINRKTARHSIFQRCGVKLIIGLGNPDKEYEKTFHNVGFLFADFLNNKTGVQWKRSKNFEYFKEGEVVIIKSSVFMNESGKAVSEAIKYFSQKSAIRPEQILIIHDDADIELGKYKLQFNRSSAGHKGVESIIHALKTQKFWRLRIGINGTKTGLLVKLRGRKKAGDLVLRKISNEDLKKISSVFEKASREIFH